jgi:hypothetical protein
METQRHGEHLAHAQESRKNEMLLRTGFVKMYYFALEFDREMPYPLAPPQGWEAVLIFEK